MFISNRILSKTEQALMAQMIRLSDKGTELASVGEKLRTKYGKDVPGTVKVATEVHDRGMPDTVKVPTEVYDNEDFLLITPFEAHFLNETSLLGEQQVKNEDWFKLKIYWCKLDTNALTEYLRKSSC